MKRRILLVADFRESGGTLTYFEQLLKLLEGYQHTQVEILLKPGQLETAHRLLKQFRLDVKCTPFQVPELRLSKYIGPRLNFYTEFLMRLCHWSLLWIMRRPSLVIHSTGGEMHYPLFFLPIQLLVVQHSPQLRPFNRLNQTVLNTFLGRAKQILTVSRYSRNCIVEAGSLQEDKKQFVSYIYNYHAMPNLTTRQTNSTFTVLTIGHVIDYKNPRFWLEVSKSLSKRHGPSLKFLWAGPGDELESYRRACSQYDNIEFLGYRGDIDKLYSGCDVYFQPSLLESHGIAVLGAMAHRLPCIVADVGGLPESVIDQETGFVYPGDDLGAACERIEILMADGEKRVRLGNQGKDRYEEMFSPSIWRDHMTSYLASHYGI